MIVSTTLELLPSTYVPDIDDIHADASISNPDPFKFSHGLTGVNQPANYFFVNILIATTLVPVILAICFRIITATRNDIRRVSIITFRRRHEFWKRDRYPIWGLFKQHFLYSPVWANRHDRELKISNAVNVGTLPTRPQLAIMVIYVISNLAYSLAIPEQPRAQKFAEFRGRCGALAAFNMIFVALFALRNNPLIWMLHVSYDTFNLFHRWFARLVVLESAAHVFAFGYNAYHVTYNGRDGWHSIGWILQHSLSYRWGLTALVTFGIIMVQSVGPLRHAFYRTFLISHRVVAMVAITGVYFHIADHALPQLPWIYLVIVLFSSELLARVSSILFYNFSWKRQTWTQVNLEALPGEATRVSFSLPRSWNANPGSHVHIYLPRVALWSLHPFSVAWSESSGYAKLTLEKDSSCIDDLKVERGPSTISCVVRARTGMTRALYKMASAMDNDTVCLWGAIEGPYGGYHSLDSYGTVVLFAAGVGITYQLSFVRQLLLRHNSNSAATRKVLLVWCIPNVDVIEWIQPWLEEIAAIQNFSEVVRIRLQVTRMTSLELEERVLPAYLDLRLQRCDPQRIMDEEVSTQVGAMVVTVCGPGGFSDSVRAAVRRKVCIRSIDFIEEAFSY